MLVREGYVPLCVGTVAAAAATVFVGSAIGGASWLALAVLLWIFSERRPRVPAAPLGLLAPMSGRVTHVGRDRDPWLDRDVVRVRVRPPLPGIGVIYSPTEGKVGDFWTRSAAFGAPESKRRRAGSPDCYAVRVHTDEGADVVVAVSSHGVPSRCRFDVGPGGRIGQGRRHGFVFFAAWVDLLAPGDVRVESAVGAGVVAGETVLATLRGGVPPGGADDPEAAPDYD